MEIEQVSVTFPVAPRDKMRRLQLSPLHTRFSFSIIIFNNDNIKFFKVDSEVYLRPQSQL